MMDSLITVVVPTYNRADVIPETIQSILNQTYKNIEIIVVDDGSTDNTADIIRNFSDPRVQYIRQDNRGYPAPARNKGIERSNGDYIAFCDSDDLWFKNKLEKQLSVFQRRNDIIAVAANSIRFPRNNVKGLLAITGGRNIMFYDKILSFQSMLRRSIVCNSSVMLKKKIFDKIGTLDERKELKAVEDYEYWLRVLDYQDNSIYVIKEALVAYRIHENSIGLQDTIQNQDKKISLIYDKYAEKYPVLIFHARQRLSI